MFDLQDCIDFCMSLGDVRSDFPFNQNTMVFRCGQKMFALIDLQKWQDGYASINVKNTPEQNITLRNIYSSVIPGYHMNKKHWNTIQIFEEELSQEEIYNFIKTSYNLIRDKIKKNQ